MATLAEAFDEMMAGLNSEFGDIKGEFEEYEEQEYDRFNSVDADSRRMQLLEEILYSEDAYELGITLIAQNQLWENNVNRYGEKLPKYSPHTIAKKQRIAGYPANKLDRYTNYWTGAFYNEGIAIEVNRRQDFFDFFITDRRSYFQYIPDDRVGLTPENEEYFKDVIGEWLNERLMQDWMLNEM